MSLLKILLKPSVEKMSIDKELGKCPYFPCKKENSCKSGHTWHYTYNLVFCRILAKLEELRCAEATFWEYAA